MYIEGRVPSVSWCVMGVQAVFLVGFMASGKSTVGPELARRQGWEFVDLDSRIETREQKTVAAIFHDSGEPEFRRAETAALLDLTTSLERDTVVALGGGAFIQPRNRELLQPWPTVFLHASHEELWRRSQQDGIERPLLQNRQQFSRLYEERLPSYRQATITIDTAGKEPASICAEIERALQLASPADRSGNIAAGHPSSRRDSL
jgi:shikimate kinase